MACIESFVTDADPDAIPLMEFYETTELRGQLDNWVRSERGVPAGVLPYGRIRARAVRKRAGERAHVTRLPALGLPRNGDGRRRDILCIENSATHDHDFSATADDYVTFYFTQPSARSDLRQRVSARSAATDRGPSTWRRRAAAGRPPARFRPASSAGWHEAPIARGRQPVQRAAANRRRYRARRAQAAVLSDVRHNAGSRRQDIRIESRSASARTALSRSGSTGLPDERQRVTFASA